MNIQEVTLNLTLEQNTNETVLAINALTDADRIKVREYCEELGLIAPRNLYYNYQTQQWI